MQSRHWMSELIKEVKKYVYCYMPMMWYFLCEKENDLQKMLKTLKSWCYSNKINVIWEKSKIVHFRTQSVTCSNFPFVFNGKEVDIVWKYTHLGNNHLTWKGGGGMVFCTDRKFFFKQLDTFLFFFNCNQTNFFFLTKSKQIFFPMLCI